MQSEFDVLTEAGYSLEVVGYDFEAMIKDSPANVFITKIEKAREGKNWYTHEADLLRALILYKHGGIYMDTDIIVVRPVNSLQENVLAWEDAAHDNVNSAFLKFEKGNSYIELYLREFAAHYISDTWGGNGPQLYTRVLREWESRC